VPWINFNVTWSVFSAELADALRDGAVGEASENFCKPMKGISILRLTSAHATVDNRSSDSIIDNYALVRRRFGPTEVHARGCRSSAILKDFAVGNHPD
jgi:hypothetical protein